MTNRKYNIKIEQTPDGYNLIVNGKLYIQGESWTVVDGIRETLIFETFHASECDEIANAIISDDSRFSLKEQV